jgi:hypothetical protein
MLLIVQYYFLEANLGYRSLDLFRCGHFCHGSIEVPDPVHGGIGNIKGTIRQLRYTESPFYEVEEFGRNLYRGDSRLAVDLRSLGIFIP